MSVYSIGECGPSTRQGNAEPQGVHVPHTHRQRPRREDIYSGFPFKSLPKRVHLEGLATGQTFSSKHFLRSKLARTLRGSLRSSTKPPDSYTGHLSRPVAPQSLSPAHFTETKGLATVLEEEPVDDWVDDFEPITREEVAELEAPPPEPEATLPQPSSIDTRSIDHSQKFAEPIVRSTSERSHSSDPFATPRNYHSTLR